MQFTDFKLSKELIKAIHSCNYSEPTQIQQKAIEHILKKRDIQAIAPTGTGKTAAFCLPIINNILTQKYQDTNLKALILVPTKELALQIYENIQQYTKYTSIKSEVIYGGAKMSAQITKLQNHIDILVATTGRLSEHLKQKTISLRNLEVLVLDEADTMLDMGFINEIDLVLSKIEYKPQILLFSATLGQSIKKLSDKILNKAVCINVDKEQKATHKINQGVYYISKIQKNELLSFIIARAYKDRFIVFTRTKQGAKEVYQYLKDYDISVICLHGDLTQGARLKAIKEFKQNKAQVLVATDISARGIDIDSLEYVINYDIPNSVDDYIHRIGRTGRAGKTGNAISLISPSEIYSLKVIERKLNLKFKELYEDGFNSDLKDKIKSPKIVIKKEEKRKVKGAFGNKKKGPKKKKYATKRDRSV